MENVFSIDEARVRMWRRAKAVEPVTHYGSITTEAVTTDTGERRVRISIEVSPEDAMEVAKAIMHGAMSTRMEAA